MLLHVSTPNVSSSGSFLHTLPNYISTTAALAKINEVFKALKLSNVIKWLLLHAVCMVAVCTVCNKIIQSVQNNNHFIMLDSFNVLNILLILTIAAIVLT